VKVLFRKAQARTHLGLYDEARADLECALSHDPNNNDIKAEL